MSPNETLFLESTAKIFKDDVSNNSFINFQIWDVPGQPNFLFDHNFDLDVIFGGTGALIFVIDAQVMFVAEHCSQLLHRCLILGRIHGRVVLPP